MGRNAESDDLRSRRRVKEETSRRKVQEGKKEHKGGNRRIKEGRDDAGRLERRRLEENHRLTESQKSLISILIKSSEPGGVSPRPLNCQSR